MGALDDVHRLVAIYVGRHEDWPAELRLDAPRLHALARELSEVDFERLCLRVRLRARRTPGASVGGQSVVQLDDAGAPCEPALARARAWLGIAPLDAQRPATFEQAFRPRPDRWGLRGDPHLWDALRLHVAGRRVPAQDGEVEALLQDAISELIGCDLRTSDARVGVPAFAVGSGMSDGLVDRDFWLSTALPLLVRRAADLRRS